MTLHGGSHARREDGEGDGKPWDHSHLEVQAEGSAMSQKATSREEGLEPREEDFCLRGQRARM